jgi:hypothetical protein
MGTLMLIGLATFQTRNQLMLSCFFVGMVLLVRIRKNDQQLYYHAQRLNKKVQ